MRETICLAFRLCRQMFSGKIEERKRKTADNGRRMEKETRHNQINRIENKSTGEHRILFRHTFTLTKPCLRLNGKTGNTVIVGDSVCIYYWLRPHSHGSGIPHMKTQS